MTTPVKEVGAPQPRPIVEVGPSGRWIDYRSVLKTGGLVGISGTPGTAGLTIGDSTVLHTVFGRAMYFLCIPVTWLGGQVNPIPTYI